MSEIRSIAEIEKDNERLSNIYSQKWVREERYTHTLLDDEGFVVDAELAQKILKSIKPEYLSVKCERYYFINDKYSAAIVGVDSENVGLFTAELPKEVGYVVDDPVNLSDTLNYFENESNLLKKVRIRGNIIVSVIFVVICACLFFAIGWSRVSVFALVGIGVVSLIILSLNMGG